MANPFWGDIHKKDWCLVYKAKYVLRIGTWHVVNRVLENIPTVCEDEYKMLHISVCNDLIFVWPKPSRYEKDTETHPKV